MIINGLYWKDGVLYLQNGMPHPNPGMIPGNLHSLIPVQNSSGWFGHIPGANPYEPEGTYSPTHVSPEPGTPITIGKISKQLIPGIANTTIYIVMAIVILGIIILKFL